MKKLVVIHAGLPKTGTTYLQGGFARNQAWLAKHGVAYPSLGREGTAGHHNLVRYLQGEEIDQEWARRQPEEVFRELLAGDEPCVLLSSEEFSSLRGAALETLRGQLDECTVRWVVYIRRRSSVCLSRWQEDVKHGLTETLPEYLASQVLGAGDVLRPEDALTVAGGAFGGESLRIVVFDQVISDRVDLFTHFVAEQLSLSIDAGVLALSEWSNPSSPLALIEAVRAMNAACAPGSRLVPGRRRFSASVLQYLNDDADGRALRDDVKSIYDQHAVPLPLSELDRLWKNRDYEILHVCRSQIANLPSGGGLFPESEPVCPRVLAQSVLYQHIEADRFIQAVAAMALVVDAGRSGTSLVNQTVGLSQCYSDIC